MRLGFVVKPSAQRYRLYAAQQRDILVAAERRNARSGVLVDIINIRVVRAFEKYDVCLGRVVLVFHTRACGGLTLCELMKHSVVNLYLAENLSELLDRHSARTEHSRNVCRESDYSALESHSAFAAVEHCIDFAIHVVHDVFGCGRTWRTRQVRGRRRERSISRADNRLSQGVRRKTYCYGIKSCRNLIRNSLALFHDDSQRSRPEGFGEGIRRVRYFADERETVDVLKRRDMYNKRIIHRSALSREDIRDRRSVERVGGKTVDRLRGNRDKTAA